MNDDVVELLREEIANMNKAADHLQVSLARCAGLAGSEDIDELERLEALSSRFARLADILTQRVMRLVDDVELLPGGTLLDRIFQAEKRGWVSSADQLIRIRKLRNVIAHDYAAESREAIHVGIAELAPDLLAVVSKASSYADGLARRLEARR